jgi:hypothetical protein
MKRGHPLPLFLLLLRAQRLGWKERARAQAHIFAIWLHMFTAVEITI